MLEHIDSIKKKSSKDSPGSEWAHNFDDYFGNIKHTFENLIWLYDSFEK